MTMLITVSAAAIVNAESNILLAQRPQGKSMAGLWEFPGGKVEQGESPEACLIRELKEELDITIKVESDLHPITFVSHAYTDFHLLMLLYGIRTWRGEAKGLEGQALQWADFHQLSTVPMPPADSPLLAPLKAYIEGA